MGREIAQRFSGAMIQAILNASDFVGGERHQPGPSGHILTDQTIGILIPCALSVLTRIGEEDRETHARIGGEFRSVIERQG